ncbi:MAG: UDP-2,3-diacylglucosamine diphosphatase [Gammaproteobacteria bacterium]|nr:UDP-2,3-diacylglucosamine diphosphatase [Gammaproteobacteria bacterium]
MSTLFVSDVHLSAARPQMAEAFSAFLAGPARRAQTLYILGDLFDAWLGDDDLRQPHGRIVEELAALTASGVPVFMVHGNHDFLIGARFVELTGCRLLADHTRIEVAGTPVLVMHGDTLCTRDTDYQAFRRMTRDPENQRQFLALPLAERAKRAAGMQREAHQAVQLKAEDIMDVTPDAVSAALREHGVRHLVHGHTHRPRIHDFTLDGDPAVRIVLSPWYEHGSALVWDDAGYRLTPVEDL